MKRFWFALWMGSVAGLMVLAGQDPGPVMVVDNPVKDFGKVMKGATLGHVFRLRNEGKGALEILSVGATCGCQTNSLSTKLIEAGQSGQIEVKVDTTLLVGPVNESVNIVSNDPHRPSILLSIKADVQPEIGVSSPSIFFENIPKGRQATKEVILTVAPEKAIRILSAESTDESVSVKLEPVPDSNDKQVKLIATHKSDGKIGYRAESIIVKTTSYVTPELTIYLLIRNFKH